MRGTMASSKHSKPVPPPGAAAPVRKASWERPPSFEAAEQTGWQYGPGAVQHGEAIMGRRSALFPGLNITATAHALGVTKSHLAKVLAGVNQPSVSLALKIAEALGTDLNVIVGLYRGTKADKKSTRSAVEPTSTTSRKKILNA